MSLFLSKVEQQRLKFMSDRIVAQTELRKKLGQLLYLNNLAKVKPVMFFSNVNYTLITDEQSTSSPGSLPFTSLVAEERHP